MSALAAALPGAVLLGLAGGAHCVTMCALPIQVVLKRRYVPILAQGAVQRGVRPANAAPLLFHVGRLTCYTLLGAVFGALGDLGRWIEAAQAFSQALLAVAYAWLLVVALTYALGLPAARFASLAGGPVWAVLRRALPMTSRAPGVVGSLLSGAIWGFMPCGLIYAALPLAVVSGDTLAGAVTMAGFGLGTLPWHWGVVSVAPLVAKAPERVLRASAGVVSAFALVMLLAPGEVLRLLGPHGLCLVQ